MSELRQDPVSGDWIILATERATRPHELLPERKKRQPTPVSKCPFEDLEKSGNWPPIMTVPNPPAGGSPSAMSGSKWRVAVIWNKYPALSHYTDCALHVQSGPYGRAGGIGHHELAITKNHRKNLAHLGKKEAVELFEVLRKRYQHMREDKCLVYTSTFFNWGESAGASLFHPHLQMLTLPIIPPDVSHSLSGSHRYFKEHRRCVHCEMVKFEAKSRKRIIAGNSAAIAVAPFVSRSPFEMRIFPKRHYPYFEKTPKGELEQIVSLLQLVLRKTKKNLRDPDLNFFIHTAPIKNQVHYKHYHWHIEILPKISIPAGFELGTGIEINIVDPDAAAAILRK